MKSARDIALDYFLQEIKDGHLKPGDKIQNERQLSVDLGISRVPLREAICTLSTLGILEVRQGSGTYVGQNDSHIFSNIIKKYGFFNRAMVDEVFEARILFESDAAKLAAINRNEQDISFLNEALFEHEQALSLYDQGKITEEEMMEFDGKVHLGIAASSHNQFLLQIIEAIRHVTQEEDYFSKENTNDFDHFKKSKEMHRKIVEAIENQEANQAYALMQEHISQVKNALNIESIRRKQQ